MAFLITDYDDPEVIPEDKDMKIHIFVRNLPWLCSAVAAYMKKLYLLLRPELFPSRLLQQHDAVLQGEEEPIFGLYFQLLILKRNAHNKHGDWENQFSAL